MNGLQPTIPDLSIAHVADFYRRYPGEQVSFYTRVEVRQPLPDLTIRITLPAGLLPVDAHILEGPPILMESNERLETEPAIEANHVVWEIQASGVNEADEINERLPAGTRCEVQVQARVAPTARDLTIESRAMAICDAHQRAVAEVATIAVAAKGRYLAHLPALYADNDLMARFLMLFESFWAPIERQIEHLPYYFDSKLTPPDFLPWLASWLDLALDPRWPEERRRELIRSAVRLYRMRGTRRGLRIFLKLYTGVEPQITEHRAKNFILGAGALLGPGVALGEGNKPHTFTVVMRLPPIEESEEEGEEHVAHQERDRRQIIRDIIEAEKPAHTDYTLQLVTG